MGLESTSSESCAEILVNKHSSPILSKLALVRKPYRSLLNGGCGYASFDVETVGRLVKQLASRAPILDPMSGYGSLLDICAKKGIPSVSVEISAPLHLWQLIRKPDISDVFIAAIDSLLSKPQRWPSASKRADCSQQWFTEESLDLLGTLMRLSSKALERSSDSSQNKAEVLAAALVVPFCGRLSCYTESENNPTWVKQGGIVVYDQWQSDFGEYLIALRSLISRNAKCSVPGVDHEVILGDCRRIHFDQSTLRAMLTSPPYPNRMDYFSMFEPEALFCARLNNPDLVSVPSSQYVGSNVVKGTARRQSSIRVVGQFLNYVQSSSPKTKQKAANATYYHPYFANYFDGLCEAYGNVANAIAGDFKGYVIVQNNHFRDREVPVAQAVIEIWQALGFDAKIADQREVFHTGTKNPRARGAKAKQFLYTLEITK